MNVCHVWHGFFPVESGGVERYILSLSTYLSKIDHNNHFSLITDRSAYVPLSQSLKVSAHQEIGTLKVHRLGPNPCSLLKGGHFKLTKKPSEHLDKLLETSLYNQAANIKDINNVDVFHIHGIWRPLYPRIGLLLSQKFHRPFLVTLHGDSVNPNDPFAMPLRAHETTEILIQANAITTFSVETIRVLRKLGLARKAQLIPNFIDIRKYERPSSATNPSGIKIVMVSRLSKPKDPITPIRAFAKFRKKFPNATFDVVGYGPLYGYLKKLVHELNLESSVNLVGMKSDVRKYLWESDIYVGTRGSYITTLEAWAAGLVVVAPNFGIMKEMITRDKTGFLTTPNDADELASVLISLADNTGLRKEVVAKSKQNVENYDIRNIAPRIVSIYKSFL